MNTLFRKAAVVVALAGLVMFSQTLSATPGGGVRTRLYTAVSSSANISADSIAGKFLMLMFGKDKEPINILNIHSMWQPGAFSGWHTHPGPGIVIVEQGTLTIEEVAGCYVDYPQGSVLLEGGPDHIHNALNRTSAPVVLGFYFFLPAADPPGSNFAIDEPVQYGQCK